MDNIYKQYDAEENTILWQMAEVQNIVEDAIKKAYRTNDFIFLFRDIQDTPDTSYIFHYGKCRIPKHPLGIIKECESAELTCTVQQHLDDLENPIISRNGPKGGRFIDIMYACSEGIEKVMKISIIILSNIDLGLKKFEVRKEKEERIDFKRILSIPVYQKHGSTDPTLNTNAYKGADFCIHAQLFDTLYFGDYLLNFEGKNHGRWQFGARNKLVHVQMSHPQPYIQGIRRLIYSTNGSGSQCWLNCVSNLPD